MKARQARKIFNRLSVNFHAARRYKLPTIAAAFSRQTGMYCKPEDAIVVCALAHLISQGKLSKYLFQIDTWLAS